MKIDLTSRPGEDLPPLPFSPYLYSEFVSATETAARTMYTADQMRAYAAEAVLAERERCAKLAVSYKDYHDGYKGPYNDAREYHSARADAGHQIAAAIRDASR